MAKHWSFCQYSYRISLGQRQNRRAYALGRTGHRAGTSCPPELPVGGHAGYSPLRVSDRSRWTEGSTAGASLAAGRVPPGGQNAMKEQPTGKASTKGDATDWKRARLERQN